MSRQSAAEPDRLAMLGRGCVWACQRRLINPGERSRILCASSDVCMHMRVAGKPMDVELVEQRPGHPGHYMAQLYPPDDPEPFSFPVFPGEAGIHQDAEGQHYLYAPVPPGVEAGWQPHAAGYAASQVWGPNRYLTDRWDDAQRWLSDRVRVRASDARWWAAHTDCTPPPCQACGPDCWQPKAHDLASLAEAVQQPLDDQREWSHTAAGLTYYLRRRQP